MCPCVNEIFRVTERNSLGERDETLEVVRSGFSHFFAPNQIFDSVCVKGLSQGVKFVFVFVGVVVECEAPVLCLLRWHGSSRSFI